MMFTRGIESLIWARSPADVGQLCPPDVVRLDGRRRKGDVASPEPRLPRLRVRPYRVGISRTTGDRSRLRFPSHSIQPAPSRWRSPERRFELPTTAATSIRWRDRSFSCRATIRGRRSPIRRAAPRGCFGAWASERRTGSRTRAWRRCGVTRSFYGGEGGRARRTCSAF